MRSNQRRSGLFAGPRLDRLAVKFSAISVVVVAVSVLVTPDPVAAQQPLAVYVGYMDTHTSSPAPNQPNPWPFTSPSNYSGSPCSGYPTSTTCWDASAIRLDNPNSSPVIGVHVVANIGGSIYDLWGSVTVPALGILVMTETGSQNSTNFDGSDYPPNAYNSGNFADCTNNGVIPVVSVTVGVSTTNYFDNTQVLNGGGHDAGHCVGSTYVSGRMDESHPWTLVSAPAQAGPTVTSLSPSSGSAAGGTQVTITGSGFTGVSQVAFSGVPASSFNFVSDSQVTAVAPAGTGTVDVSITAGGVTSPVNQPADQFTYISPPGAPTALTATAGNASISLSWTAPASNGGASITGYNVLRSTTSGAETALSSGVVGTAFTDSTVSNGTTYFYKVAAVNSVGPGPLSNEASATPATVPSAPQNLVASAGNGSVSLSWTAPASNGGAAVTSYNVLRSTSSGAESSLSSGVVGTTFTDSTVSNGTTYFYKVAAVNSVGPGPLSNEASATPAPTVPSAPQNLVAVAGNSGVALSWAAPASNGGAPVTSYNVLRSTTNGTETLLSSGVVGTTFTDSTVSNGTTFFYKVAAVNSVGPGPLSNEASATPQVPPSAGFVRRIASATAAAGGTSIALTVGAPGVAAGDAVVVSVLLSSTSSITGALFATDTAGNLYTIARDVNDGSAGDRVVVLVALNVKALAATNQITLKVPSAGEIHASADVFAGVTGIDTSAGASASTTTFSAGPVTTSQTPEILVGAVGMESGSSPTWAAAWSPLPALAISSDYLDSAYQVVNTTGPFTATGTTRGTWMAAIVALKASGTPLPPPPTVPGAPTALTATAGNASISLSWTAPASNGGASITGYNVLRSTTSGAETALSSGVTGTTYTDSSALNGTTYFYKVTAVNSAGPGAASNEASATPTAAPTVPSAPQNLTASAGNASVLLSWAAPASNGGAPVGSYNVWRSTSSGTESLLTSGVVGTSYTDSSALNGITYFYKVAAVNSVGSGPLSNEASATPATVPSAPQNLVASAGNGSVSLSWTAPASNGGAAVTSYNVLRSTSSGAESSLSSGVVGTTFFYKVAAVNSVGPGPLSNEASATPQVPPSAGFVRRIASATAAAGGTSIALTVGAPGVAAGDAVVVSVLLSSTSSI